MIRLTDGIKIVEIEMMVWRDDYGLSPDRSQDFFDAPYNEESESHIVNDVDYCIEQAVDWKAEIGEYNDNPSGEERIVNVTVIAE